MGKKLIVPLMTLLLLVSLVESYTVAVYNPTRMLVNVLIVKMESGMMSLDINREEQSLSFSAGQGDRAMSVNVKDGDIVVVVPEFPIGSANVPAVQVVEISPETN